ncbi:hypothetical protein BpHYR1_023985 [Brachionus plicatilis]|uniref:Uncharacterized protein n=1 Tax=Brachionus plicatilis TaxID=10195 RepID=A0A3M7SHX5_BRAPC|nr:hypothetical protein BpHYR1_023985 [Brachionus plicatilis]
MLAPEYYSSQEETDVETEKTVHESQKTKRKMPTWEIIHTFDKADDAEKSIGKEGSKCTKYDTAATMLNFLYFSHQ